MGRRAAHSRRDALASRRNISLSATPAQLARGGGGSTWFTAEFTQPAGYVLAAMAAEATVTVPPAWSGSGAASIVVDVGQPDSSLVGLAQWSMATVGDSVTIVLADKGVTLMAPAVATTRTLTVTLIDTCGGSGSLDLHRLRA